METMHQPVEVIYKKVDTCPSGNLHFTFFQMVYVISGEGVLAINGNRLPYKKGNLLLMTPDDRHNFEIIRPTEFLQVRFNSSYIREYRWKSIDHMECLLYYASHLSGCILHNESDGFLVRTIAEAMLHDRQHGNIYNEDLAMHFVNALIVIAARNLASIRPANLKANADKRILDIIHYIQANIYYPEKLKAPVIARQMDISPGYLGSYFKSQCDETIQQFIAQYRIRLIEHRLKFSDSRINEIVSDLGFADESHLNKFFKKHRKMSLTAFRKAWKSPAAN